jgi:uncharacterized protein
MQLSEFFQRIGYVTLKVTNGCNLKCSYCNVEALTPQTPKMSLELVKKVADLLIANSKSQFVGLEFHGGEPLLMPDEWFEEAVTYAKALAKKHRKIIEFPVTTNGTMLTEARLQFLTKLGIKWCMSCDGPPHINDVFRQSGRAVERAIKLFRDHKIYAGIICVMSQSNYNRMTEVMDWFREVGVFDFRVNFLQPQGRGIAEDLLTGDQMYEGMRQVLEHMYKTDVAVHEATTTLMSRRFVYDRDPAPRLSCWEFQCQAGRTYCAVDLLGRIHACGTDLSNHVIGHISQDLDEAEYQRKLTRLHDKGKWVIRCFDCNAKQICNHSCPTSDYNSEMFKEHDCRHTILLWNYMCEHPEVPERVTAIVDRQRGMPTGAFVPVQTLELAPVN